MMTVAGSQLKRSSEAWISQSSPSAKAFRGKVNRKSGDELVKMVGLTLVSKSLLPKKY